MLSLKEKTPVKQTFRVCENWLGNGSRLSVTTSETEHFSQWRKKEANIEVQDQGEKIPNSKLFFISAQDRVLHFSVRKISVSAKNSITITLS
ncbi:hypothetical protein CEXT_539101 [Caerostris extrusa]|uniref:Uncharacterized protein n=1 Tax=Caerostris extrusa TaxID=172846 RepID=A0AAV4PB48_CAEEX|nr:hypothetical protein CEXT_539101 [Caerostris extrusa]